MGNKKYFSFNSTQTKIINRFLKNLNKKKYTKSKFYLKQEIIQSSHDMRKFWYIMKALLPNKSTRAFPNYIHVDD